VRQGKWPAELSTGSSTELFKPLMMIFMFMIKDTTQSTDIEAFLTRLSLPTTTGFLGLVNIVWKTRSILLYWLR
jgi:hypothetical protein